MVICGPQPQKTVPLIASQISDRDNAVRSAALNTMVIVYGNVGDGVFKFTSKVSTGHGVDVCIQNSCSILHTKLMQHQWRPLFLSLLSFFHFS